MTTAPGRSSDEVEVRVRFDGGNVYGLQLITGAITDSEWALWPNISRCNATYEHHFTARVERGHPEPYSLTEASSKNRTCLAQGKWSPDPVNIHNGRLDQTQDLLMMMPSGEEWRVQNVEQYYPYYAFVSAEADAEIGRVQLIGLVPVVNEYFCGST